MAEYQRWRPQPGDFEALSPTKVRLLLEESYFQVHRDVLLRTKASLGLSTDEEGLRRTVRGTVREAFARTGGEYDAPTTESIHAVVEFLKTQSALTGTPQEVIDYHATQIHEVLRHLSP